jgi:O-antigen ligase/Tfp pilus assembly protein PilF
MEHTRVPKPSSSFSQSSFGCQALDRLITAIGFTALLAVPLVFQPRMYTAYRDVKQAMVAYCGLLCLLFISLLVLVCGGKKRASPLPILPVLLAVYAAITLASLFRALNLDAGLWNCQVVLACLVMAFWAYRQSTHPTFASALIHVLAATVIVISLYGFLQYNGIDVVRLELQKSPVSTIGNLNFTAQYLIGAIPLFASAIIIARCLRTRLFLLIVLSLAVVHLLLTQSRGGLVGLGVSTLVFLVLYTRYATGSLLQYFSSLVRKKGRKFVVVCVGGLIVAASYCVLDSGKTLEQIVSIFTTRKETNIYRLLTWRDTLRMVANHPILGVGVGNYQFAFPLYKSEQLWRQQDIFGRTRQIRTHNDYLNMLAETGVLGLATFLTIVGIVVAHSLRQLNRGRGSPSSRTVLQIGLISGLSATLTQSFFDFNLYNPASALLFWVSLGLLAGLPGDVQSPKAAGRASLRNVRHTSSPYLALGFMLIVGLMSLYSTFALRPYVASYHNQQARESLDRHRPADALKPLNLALALDRRNIDSVAMLADAYRDMENFQEARRYYELWASLEPNFPPIYNRLGLCYVRLGDYARAEESFHTAIALNPLHAAALSNLGNLYLAAGQYEKAVEYLERASGIESDVARTNRRNYSAALMHVRRYDQALEVLTNLSHDKPDNVEILTMIVACYRAQGNSAAAEVLEQRIMILTKAHELPARD